MCESDNGNYGKENLKNYYDYESKRHFFIFVFFCICHKNVNKTKIIILLYQCE